MEDDKPNTKKKNEKKRTKKPCHRRTNQNLPVRRLAVSISPPSKDVLRLREYSLLEAFLQCSKNREQLRALFTPRQTDRCTDF